jgi:hypothetical protein
VLLQRLEDMRCAAVALPRLLQRRAALPAEARLCVLFAAVELLEAPVSPPLFGVAETQQLLSSLLV